jgi:hypothetical protein
MPGTHVKDAEVSLNGAARIMGMSPYMFLKLIVGRGLIAPVERLGQSATYPKAGVEKLARERGE